MSVEDNFLEDVVRNLPRKVSYYSEVAWSFIDSVPLQILADWYGENDEPLKQEAIHWLLENKKIPCHWSCIEGKDWTWDSEIHHADFGTDQHRLLDCLPDPLYQHLGATEPGGFSGRFYPTLLAAMNDFYGAFRQWKES